jgi:hypothetical protein
MTNDLMVALVVGGIILAVCVGMIVLANIRDAGRK